MIRPVLATVFFLMVWGVAAAPPALARCAADEAIPRKVVLLTSVAGGETPWQDPRIRQLRDDLARLGMVVVPVNGVEGLSMAADAGDIAGVVTWLTAPFDRPAEVIDWRAGLQASCGQVPPWLAIGDPGDRDAETGVLGALGLTASVAPVLYTGAPMAQGAEAFTTVPRFRPGLYPGFGVTSETRGVLAVTDANGRSSVQAAVRGTSAYLSFAALDALGRVPDAFLQLFAQSGPVPDRARVLGRQAFVLVVHPDGWAAREAGATGGEIGLLGADRLASVDTGAFPVALPYGGDGALFEGDGVSRDSARSAFDAYIALPHVKAIDPDVLSGEHPVPAVDRLIRRPGWADVAGLHRLTDALGGADAVAPVAFEVVVSDLLVFSDRRGAERGMSALADPNRIVVPIRMAEAAAEAFAAVRITELSEDTYLIEDSLGLTTVRFDGARDKHVDLDRSVGVLGARRGDAGIVVFLDPAAASKRVVLTAGEPAGGRPGLVDGSIVVSGLSVSRCVLQVQATGSGAGELTWQVRPGQGYDVTVGGDATRHTADEAGLIRVDVPASFAAPVPIRLERTGC